MANSSNSNLDSFEDLNESLGQVSVESDIEKSNEFSQGISNSAWQAVKYDEYEYVESDSEFLESLALDRPPQFVNITNSKKFREANQQLRAKMLYYYHTCLEKKCKLLRAPSNIAPITLNIPIDPAEEVPHSSSTDPERPKEIYTTKFGRQTRRKPCFEQSDEEDFDTEWQSKTTNRSKNKSATLRNKAKTESPHETASSSSSSQKSKKKGLSNNESKFSFLANESLVSHFKRTWSTKEEGAVAENNANGNAQNQTVDNKKATRKYKSSKPSSKRTKTLDSNISKDCANENTSSRRQVKKLEEVECPLCEMSFADDEIEEHAARCGE